jgi:hypothetical protein
MRMGGNSTAVKTVMIAAIIKMRAVAIIQEDLLCFPLPAIDSETF